ncbi:MAG: hypothetical protein BA865_06785 [Desulfobacterales bacterium S5133MH4]|nr:MAG: hypothetical protein BA865_06785 [Desulfobacterales bacterium S5133MH4]
MAFGLLDAIAKLFNCLGLVAIGRKARDQLEGRQKSAPLRFAIGIMEHWNIGILGLKGSCSFMFFIPVFHHSNIPALNP